ncbi:MAG: competence protein TfoX [Oscillospiraceae bacterium]|nr:competence protein TfoX [Oscillospiraceae bacterium]
MASDKSYLDYIMDQFSGLEGVSYRAMMGEYIIYVNGKTVGGIYDNRFLVKPVLPAVQLMPDAPREVPYPGAKEMLLVTDPDNRELMEKLLTAVSAVLPEPKPRK